MADQYDIVEIPLYELVHQVVDLLYMVHPFLYTFPMAEDRRCESLMAHLVQVSDDRGPARPYATNRGSRQNSTSIVLLLGPV